MVNITCKCQRLSVITLLAIFKAKKLFLTKCIIVHHMEFICVNFGIFFQTSLFSLNSLSPFQLLLSFLSKRLTNFTKTINFSLLLVLYLTYRTAGKLFICSKIISIGYR